MPPKQIAGATLIHLRKVLGPKGERTRTGRPLSQAEVARKIGKSQTHLSQVERGLSPASVEMLFDLADVYGLIDHVEIVHAYYRNGRRQSKTLKIQKPRGVHAR